VTFSECTSENVARSVFGCQPGAKSGRRRDATASRLRDVTWRRYDEDRDGEELARIWHEVGWVDGTDAHAAGLRTFFSGGHGLVAPADGEVEAAIHWVPGTYRWLDHDVPAAAVSALTTGFVGRRRGHGPTLVAEALAQMVDVGVEVATLGAFEQGYYDRFGFGADPYDHRLTFDPGALRVPIPDRRPVRVGTDDHAEVQALLARRHRSHGGLVLDHARGMEAALVWRKDPWGLGLRADDGRLTGVVLGEAGGEHGPHTVEWLLYETTTDLLELLGVLRLLSDQVWTVVVDEPPDVRLQDLLDAPNRQRAHLSQAGRGGVANTAHSWRQTRILDLAACLGRVHWPGEPFAFDLDLVDPLADRGGRWPGIGGAYTVAVGEETSVTDRRTGERPLLTASVDALSRMWTGSRPTSGLAVIGAVAGPADLVARLDAALRLPPPMAGIPY